MNPALWAAKTGLDAQEMRMTVVSHNLANVNTSGFKRGRAVFEDLLYQNIRQVGAQTIMQVFGDARPFIDNCRLLFESMEFP